MKIQNIGNIAGINLNSNKVEPGLASGKTSSGFKDKLSIISGNIQNIENQWQSIQNKSVGMINALPKNVQPLVQTQLLVNDLSLKSQMITKVGESVSSTVKRLQQMG